MCYSFIRSSRAWRTAAITAVGLFTANLVPPSASAQTSSGGKHCLWRVTNARAPFYLLGSVHALRSSDYPLAPVINDAIQQSQNFVFEVDPNKDALFASKLVAAAKYPNGVQIKGRINPKTYAFLQKITVSGMNTWQHLRPWAIATFLLRHPGFERVSDDYGLDNYVWQKARARGRPGTGIESVDEHIRVLSDMEDIEGEVMLLQSLVYADEGPKRYNEAVALWKAGNVNGIYAMDEPRMKEAPTVWWRLLDRRNARWIPRIEALIKWGKPTMIVAGTAHFAGPHSVIAMLRARGYKIEQL